MTPTIDINADVGESFGAWALGDDAGLLAHVTTANVACGFHAGDPLTMRETVRVAKANGSVVGAHPGLPDLLGFGRRLMSITADEIYAYVLYQAGSLQPFLAAEGLSLHHVKFHGALVRAIERDAETAAAAAAAVKALMPNPVVYWPSSPSADEFVAAAGAAGLHMVKELFPDLSYDDAGFIAIQRKKLPTPPEAVAEQVRLFVSTGQVRSAGGKLLDMPADSICLHGDGHAPVAVAEAVTAVLADAGWELAPATATTTSSQGT